MPVDGLGTDEQLESPAPKQKEFEAQLMAGCSTIAVTSLITYFMTAWPFAVFPEYSIVGLGQIFLFGALPATVLGVIASRKFALAGASGYFGGAMAAAVFMHLRFQQTALGYLAPDMPKPDYPPFLIQVLPFAWFAGAGLIAFVFYRRERPEM